MTRFDVAQRLRNGFVAMVASDVGRAMPLRAFVILLLLYEGDQPSLTELAARVNSTTGSAQRWVERLVELNFARCKPDAVDKRVRKVMITRVGRTYLDKLLDELRRGANPL